MKVRKISLASFTLVEMLTAIVVLSILLIMIFGLVGSALKLSDSTGRKADSSNEANQVLDRIGADIASMLNRPDVDQFYYKTPVGSTDANDKMFFYSQQTGFFDTTVAAANQSPMTFIGYRINASDNPGKLPMLERLAQGLCWDADPSTTKTIPLPYLTFPASTLTTPFTYGVATAGAITNTWNVAQANPYKFKDVGTAANNYNDGTSVFYDTIGSQVFRMELCFQHQDGKFYQYPGYTNSAPVYPASLTNTVAIVVAIAVLDSRSRKNMPAASWAYLTNGTALPDITDAELATNGLMDTIWNNALNQSTFASANNIPAAVAAKIKVYQRYFYLPAPKAQ